MPGTRWPPGGGDHRLRRERRDRGVELMAVGATESTVDFERTPGGAVLMNGIRLRDEIVLRLRGEIEAAGSPPVCLATVLVGVDKPSQIYVRSKHKKAEEAGMRSLGIELPETASQAEVEDAVDALAADPSVHGILCQLPLPAGLDAEAGARPGAHRQGRRRVDRELDGSPPARPARSRRLHAARRDAPARAVRRHHLRASAPSSSDVRRSSDCRWCCCSAARASTPP